MFLHSLSIIKLLFFIFLLFFGITSMFSGFNSLKKINDKNINIKDVRLGKNSSNINSSFEKNTIVLKKDKIINESPKYLNKAIKDTHNINIVIVKKGETFSKIIDPFFNLK